MSQPIQEASHIARMNIRFISTGTSEASVKRPKALSTPESSATSEMNMM